MPEDLAGDLRDAARRTAALLQHTGHRIVFAESCTAGLVAATLAQVAGISEYLCGSAVVYREQTKQQWLAVDADDLVHYSAVSEPVTTAMATRVLAITPEATLAVAVTGHLGPGAPAESDGTVFFACAERRSETITVVTRARWQLARCERVERQCEATLGVLAHLNAWLQGDHEGPSALA